MADPLLDSRSDNRVRAVRRSLPGTPRWVNGFGLVAIVVLGVFVVLHLTGLVGMAGHH